MPAPRPPEVGDFPDLLPLRHAGAVTGLFSDHGSWLAATWGDGALLELHDTLRGTVQPCELGAPARLRAVWMDRLEASLANGAEVSIGFAADGSLAIEYRHEWPPEISCELRWAVERRGPRQWWVLIGESPCAAAVPDDLWQRNRTRWNAALARACAGLRGSSARDRLLLARAVATLLWNRRAAVRGLLDQGVIPSPFAYRGFWGWDSWKHAHALAWIDPELGLAQLRAQFAGDDPAAMVPDTVMPDPRLDNRRNTKPPMAAWALDALRHAGAGEAAVARLRARCAGWLRWWGEHRRLPGEVLFRCGGVDHETATWDSGWDLSARFAGVPLEPHGEWRLFALWPPDLNAYLLAEFAAMARLEAAGGGDAAPWRKRAEEQARLLRERLWDAARGAFCDHRPDGRSTGILSAAAWLPVWAGAASREQATAVRALLRDPRHFATPLPFPALAASEPAFDPDGYWNGGVWLDHAALAVQVLGQEGAELRERLLDAVAARPAFYECYSPLSGQPCQGARPAVPQFSWSAAAIVEILRGGTGAE